MDRRGQQAAIVLRMYDSVPNDLRVDVRFCLPIPFDLAAREI